MGVDCLLFRQKNTLDRSRRTLSIDAWNESFANRIIINEFCVYSVHPENPDWTCFEQSAELDIKNFFGFEGTAEKLAIKEYSKSIGKSKDIMEHHIGVLAVEGITSVPIWEAKRSTL
ncbi:SEC14-like protein 1 [Caligus rogercresseyi]|uniref:SEC14-like protein 1 n=1 Tax=Caligus rogercresseyi TaxID=217165 RepID=A0A7T8GPF0_CALRO|nr:SEC14-like protein 1 [Caligus rogercresseyi]